MSPCSSSSISGSALSSSNTSRPKDSRQRRGDSVLRYVPKAYSPVGFPPSVERAAFDIVIVGGGAAGPRAASAAGRAGPGPPRVRLLHVPPVATAPGVAEVG